MGTQQRTTRPGVALPQEHERGAVLPLMAFMLVVLIGTAAMAVDLG
jgi:hypothetical protein